MSARCPTCRARLADVVICHRCGTDISSARQASKSASLYGALAIGALLCDDPMASASAVKQGLRYQRNDLLVAMKGFVIDSQERRAVRHLDAGQLNDAIAALEVVLYLEATPLASILYQFVKQAERHRLLAESLHDGAESAG